MTVLDVMIAVGGLTDFADGNARDDPARVRGRQQAVQRPARDLVKRGDISANVDDEAGRHSDHPAELVLARTPARRLDRPSSLAPWTK